MSFSYKNSQNLIIKKRKDQFSSRWITKVFTISFSIIFLFFFTFKIFFLTFQKKMITFQQASTLDAPEIQKIKIPSLLINLKTKEGPRLARITVHIETKDDLVKQELLSNNKSLEKYLVLILSGQDVKDIYNRKNIFEGRIKNQVNAFLSKKLIQEVNIQAQLVN